ncbi:Methyltransferase-like protein 21D [Terramyces sp. JEL0728]|nr:Methyltransferase-like protein 21D [Terramyces sp. JEL0728]
MTNQELVIWKYKNTAVNEKYQQVRTFNFNDTRVVIQQEKQEISIEKNTGNVVWDGGYILADYIIKNFNLAGKRVVELGSGTGLVGLAVGSASTVLLTDVPQQIPLLETNIKLNGKMEHIEAKELLWGTETNLGKFDYIIGSEILYLQEQHANLIETCKSLSSRNTIVIMIYKHRGLGEHSFFDLAEHDFVVDMIPKHEYHKEFQKSDYTIFQMYLK